MCTHEALQARCNQAEIERYFKVSIADVDTTITELRRRGVTIVAEAFDLEDIGRRLAFVAEPWATSSNSRKW
ncbi:MAG: VOC family protein [Burkholderiales bacterium]